MRNVPALARREIAAIFLTPLAYVVLTLFLFFSGFCFYLVIAETKQAVMAPVFNVVISFLLLVATPLLTMRLMSEEYRSGTIESLMTAPVTDAEVVLGKFLGTLCFFLVMLGSTVAYVVILMFLGKPDLGPICAAYLGLALMGAQFIALGLFCSALTRSQLVAALAAAVLLLTIWIVGSVGDSMGGQWGPLLRYVGTQEHVQAFASGRVPFRDAFYFLSLTAFWLFLSVRAVESRRWRS